MTDTEDQSTTSGSNEVVVDMLVVVRSEGTLRPGTRNNLAPSPTKTTESEVKIGAKVRKKQK